MVINKNYKFKIENMRNMRPPMPVTPQKKIIGVNSKMGNPQIAEQQGTTVEVYDTIDIPENAGTTTFDFFIDSKTKSFPETNLKDGKLQAQEALVVDRFYLVVEQYVNGAFVASFPVEAPSNPIANPIGAVIARGEFQLEIANDRILKPIPLSSMDPRFTLNPQSRSAVIDFDTQLVIPPLLEFKLSVKVPSTPAFGENTTYKLKAVLGGVGAIFRPRSAY